MRLRTAFFSLLLALPAAAAPRPTIEFFSPQGFVKGVRQVSVRFSEPMVPFGDPRDSAEPFKIDCAAKGTARWADSRNWEFDFDKDLPAGVRCEFKAKGTLKSLAGEKLKGEDKFSFHTGGPAILRSDPYEGEWSRASEDQVFILRLDAEAKEGSVLSKVHFDVEGVGEQIGVRVVGGSERETILKARRYEMEEPGEEDLHLLLIQAKRRFPAGAKFSLVWGKGVETAGGVATEQDQILRFKTRDDFGAKFTCERAGPKDGCIPFLPMSVEFSAPLAWDKARRIVIRSAKGQAWKPAPPKEGGSEEEGEDDSRFLSRLQFKGPFPSLEDFKVELPAGLADDSGRPLANASSFPLAVQTGDFPPLAKFSARFGILEAKASPVLPVTLRNLEPQVKARLLALPGAAPSGGGSAILGRVLRTSPAAGVRDILYWLGATHKYESQWDTSLFSTSTAKPSEFVLPKPNGAKAFEVVGIPLKKPGLYVVELESPLLGQALFAKPQSMFVPTLALVTNLSVHFKWGAESSLVWVTSLDGGQPAAGAAVKISDCRGGVLWQGTTDAAGLARVGALPEAADLQECAEFAYPARSAKLVITAQLGEDSSFVLDTWNEGIEPWRFELPYEYGQAPSFQAHTVFDRTLLRAGETVRMKHYLRRENMAGFALPAYGDLPTLLRVEHEGSGQKYEFPLTWDAAGTAETAWEIPKEAKLGFYNLTMTRPEEKELFPGIRRQMRSRRRRTGGALASGGFRVEEFRVPLLKASITPPAGPIIGAGSLNLDLMVRYLAGGGVGGLPVKLRAQAQPRPLVEFEAFEGFSFANGPVPAGRETRQARRREAEPEVRAQDLTLDGAGSARASVKDLPPAPVPSQLLAELEFRDPNGEAQTVSARVPMWPAARLVGVKLSSWLLAKDNLKFAAAVADTSGKPAAGVPVSVDLFQRRVYSHRKRLVGGFYAYEHSEETVRISSACAGTTDEKGLLFCEAASPVSGNVILEARAKDEAGRESAAHVEAWLAENEDWWFESANSDRMDVIPERKRYEPGETAAFQVRMPFRDATALVTVEREGVIDSYVRRLSGKNPVVHVPIKGSYSPNVFVSVMAVRGRVGGVEPTALVDLGRPAYKLGIGEIKVGWKAHELKVAVSPDREVYKVREKARVRLKVARGDGAPPPPGAEAAVAAVDEGLLELMPNESWKLLDAMMGRRSVAVRTATAQMHVVGKRHFGLKALPQGGGGGRQPTRELFDTGLLWLGRVPLDARGEAEVEIPLNDSITAFRIAAVASAGADLFGTGQASIRSTQDLVVFPGLAPLVREGDRFRALFTLRNAADRPMEAELSGKAAELPQPFSPLAVSLAPGEAKELSWEITAPVGVPGLHYEVEAREKGGASDRLKFAQKVIPAVPVRVFQATIAQLDKPLEIPVELPKDAVPGRGWINASFAASLASQVSGIEDYMRAYPYTCLEQKISKAVALKDEALWRQAMAGLPAYLDSDGLAKFFPAMTQGCDCLTAYLLSVAHEAHWEIPASLRERMENGLAGFVEGRVVRGSAMPTADLGIRKIAALEALSRYGKVQPKMLSSIAIEPNLWPTSAVLDWWNLLQRVPGIPGRGKRFQEADQILRSRLNFQGTTMGFSTDTSDFLWWLFVSNDLNAVRFLLTHEDVPSWREDMPRLLRGALGRQRRGHWDLTTANAWGRLALDKFASRFESEPVTGAARSRLGEQAETHDWSRSPSSGTLCLNWPQGRGTLSLSQEGSGKPWVVVQSLAAIPLKEAFSSGYKIKKTVTPVSAKSRGIFSRGDIVRVRLEVQAQSDMTWVVVDDPIPGGASILGTGLGRDSALAVRGEKREGWAWPAYEERSFEAFRSYYEFIPKGSWTVEYTMRLNNEGAFTLPATRVEAMYSPEMLGELPNAPFGVSP